MENKGIVYHVFAFKDKKTLSFGKPVITEQEKDGYATGCVRAAIRSTGADRAYAKDQALYYLGTYNDETATFDTLKDPQKICDLEDYIKDGK